MPTGDSIGVREKFAADTLAVQTFTSEDITADAVTDILRLNHRTTGTPAIGLAASLSFGLESSTTIDVLAANIEAAWTTVTHATRTSDLIFRTIVNAVTTEFLRLDGSASAVVFATGIAITLAGDLAVNGGDLTSTATTFNLLNATVTTLNIGGAATTIAVGAAAGSTTWTGQAWTLTGANSTNNTTLTVTNTSNAAAASHSYLDIAVGGTTSTGDPQVRLTVPGGVSWYVGVDNNDDDSFEIGKGTAVGTTAAFIITSRTSNFGAGSWMIISPVNASVSNGGSNRYSAISVGAFTTTFAGTTQVTALQYALQVAQQTIAQSGGAITVDKAAGISAVGAAAGASVTLTHASALRALTGGAAVNVSGLYVETQTAGTTGNYQVLMAVSTGAAPALADHVGFTARDFAVGDTRLYIASEAGSDIILGGDAVRFAAAGTINTAAGDLTLDPTDNVVAGAGVFFRASVTAGITASTTQAQGNGALVSEVNQVSVCANINDTVTLPSAVAGMRCVVINSGAQTLQIFPASGDDLGNGVNASRTLAAAAYIVFQAYDATNWRLIAGG